MDRNTRNGVHQRRVAIVRRAKATQAVEFFNVLTSAQLLETTESALPEHRERLYPPTVALSMFMRQVLEADCSARRRWRNGCGAGEQSSWWTAPGFRCPTLKRTKRSIPSPAPRHLEWDFRWLDWSW